MSTVYVTDKGFIIDGILKATFRVKEEFRVQSGGYEFYLNVHGKTYYIPRSEFVIVTNWEELKLVDMTYFSKILIENL